MQQRRSPAPALGPRARRRLAWTAAIAAGLLVAGGVTYYLTGIGASSTQHQPTSVTDNSANQRDRNGAMSLQIAYGSTPKQVLRQIGSPTRRQADCWIYLGRPGRIRGRYSGPGVDGLKFCFSEGGAGNTVVTQIFDHLPARTITVTDPVTHVTTKQHFPAQWLPGITILKVPGF